MLKIITDEFKLKHMQRNSRNSRIIRRVLIEPKDPELLNMIKKQPNKKVSNAIELVNHLTSTWQKRQKAVKLYTHEN